jgi:hypothetical protein
MKDFKNILLLIENELERRNKKAIENYKLFCKLDEENRLLKKEIQMLRNDLFELSKEYTNGK